LTIVRKFADKCLFALPRKKRARTKRIPTRGTAKGLERNTQSRAQLGAFIGGSLVRE
jgi:hypothetical protein